MQKTTPILLIICTLSILIQSCNVDIKIPSSQRVYQTTKPLTRWWWFATEIKKEDVKHQLDWAKENNFGGVEIAWVYPLHRYQRMYKKLYNRNYPVDTSAQKWLSKEWIDIVKYTKTYADSIGLACDYTFGSAWPSSAPNLPKELRTQVYGKPSFKQVLTFSWQYPDTQYVINHLDSNAFNYFSQPLEEALPLIGKKNALFIDSWEIKLNDQLKVWDPKFADKFKERFNYNIIPFMEKGLDSFPDARYDYMLLLDQMVTENFYQPFAKKCKELNVASRMQCLASPTDVMNTYSLVDIPESEAMLNNPNYSRIVSSSAALSSKPIVSAESFTCMYGFPGTYLREEQVADLKLVADALFAQGINQLVYHGMPYNPKGVDSIDFFATTYVGPNGTLSNDLKDFNSYIEKTSFWLQQGKTYSNVAVYIPYEDGVMKGALPKEKQRVWVWGEYELRHIEMPKAVEEDHPLWINQGFLRKARFDGNHLIAGDVQFKSLYINVEYLDFNALTRIYELAKEGLPICLTSNPKEPGYHKNDQFDQLVIELKALKNVTNSYTPNYSAIITGEDIPAYWVKEMPDNSLLIFLAQDGAKNLKYPLNLGQSKSTETTTKEFVFNYVGNKIVKSIEFPPYQSKMIKVHASGVIEEVNIEYYPREPEVREAVPQKMYF